jgi:putative DNA primase/helicase
MSTFTFADAERITRGRIGVWVEAPCPFCVDMRRKKKATPFAVRQKDENFAGYNCCHCHAKGYVHRERSPRMNPAQRRQCHAVAERNAAAERESDISYALLWWRERQPFRGSPAETYLRITRGIGDWLDAFQHLDECLGFHPRCIFERGRYLPCLIALVRDVKSDEPIGIHRIALELGPKPQRIDRKSLGPVGTGAIKISPHDAVHEGLLVAESVETAMSASKEFIFQPAWSVIARMGFQNFPVLSGIESITVAADNDESGDGQRDATAMCERMNAAGIEAIYAIMNEEGQDFNDLHNAGTK